MCAVIERFSGFEKKPAGTGARAGGDRRPSPPQVETVGLPTIVPEGTVQTHASAPLCASEPCLQAHPWLAPGFNLGRRGATWGGDGQRNYPAPTSIFSPVFSSTCFSGLGGISGRRLRRANRLPSESMWSLTSKTDRVLPISSLPSARFE